MQEQIQAQADRIADRFGIAHVQVQRWAGLDEAERMNRMRHEMAHALHQALCGKGNLHGHEWRVYAVRVGCEPKQQAWEVKGGHKAPRQARKAAALNENPQTLADWYKYIQAHGLQKLGNGVSRTAYALSDTKVIKVEALNAHGQFDAQCASEKARWDGASADERRYLAEIYDAGKGWIVMERATKVLKNFDVETSGLVCRDLRTTTRIGDLHPGNIGYFAKTASFKVIDYAL